MLALGWPAGEAAATPAREAAATTTTFSIRVAAAGDIASCSSFADETTGDLVRSLAPRAVLTLGDNAYDDGSDADLACYHASWGSFRGRTSPAPGNHEYHTPNAAGYFRYFGARAPRSYYSFNLGPWHLVSLNSEVPHGRGSAQEQWLRRNLRADTRRCEILYWHRARWSGGTHGSDPGMQALWKAAYDHRVELVLVGHDHNYQRFHKMDDRGRRSARGVRQLVVGTGGRDHYAVGTARNRAVASADATGVLLMTLRSRGYDLRFVPVPGTSFTDRVSKASCS